MKEQVKGQNVKNSKILKTVLAICVAGTIIFSLSDSAAAMTEKTEKINISLLGKYDSADTAAIREIDTENKTIRLKNHATGKTYTLNYDNTSMMYDEHGQVLSARLLEEGEIVDVTFLKSSKHITTLKVSPEAWVIESTRDHNLVREDGTAVVRGDVYKIDMRTLIMADGKLALAEDILSTDNISVSGIGKDIYSIKVESGHGYVSLSSDIVQDQSLVGAWLELDNEVIYKISPNMLLSAPEGDYTLHILGNGANYESEVNISRNQETVVDTSQVSITRPKEGLVTFEVVPDYAEIYVDGNRIFSGVPESIQYGYHNLKIIADGYVTQSKFLKVGTPKSVVSIELEQDENAASSEESSAVEEEASTDFSIQQPTAAATVASTTAATSPSQTVSANTSTTPQKAVSANTSTTSQPTINVNITNPQQYTNYTPSNGGIIDGRKIYIDEPSGAEVYFDGNYIGMIPVSVAKMAGNHEIILKKAGYETKSYRINIDWESTDLKYEFPALVKSKEDDSSESASSESTSKSDSSTDASSDSTSKETTDDAPSKDTSDTISGNTSDTISGNTPETISGNSEATYDESGNIVNNEQEEVNDAASTNSASEGE